MLKHYLLPWAANSNRSRKSFDYMLADPYNNVFHLDLESLPAKDAPIYEDLKRCRENKKEAFVCFWYLLTEKQDENGFRPLKPDWREILDEMNEQLCEAGGEYFIGYGFDEPFYFMTSEEYIAVTKRISEYGKRVFSVHATIHIDKSLWPVDYNSKRIQKMALITPENHAYTTDVAFDYYGEWENGVHYNSIYRMMIEKLGDRFGKTKFWFFPPIGTVQYEWSLIPSEECEQICIDVFMGMWNWSKDIENFGGLAMYMYCGHESKRYPGYLHGNAEAYLLPDENGEVKWKKMASILDAVGKGFLEGKHPKDIELPEVEYNKGYIV